MVESDGEFVLIVIEKAKKLTRNGAIAGFVASGLTVIVVSALNVLDLSADLALFSNPLHYLDAVVVGAMSFGVLRHSRTCAILLFLYFLAEKGLLAYLSGYPLMGAFALPFLYFFGRAIYGAFAYHRMRRETDPAYKPSHVWAWTLLAPVTLVFYLLVGYGIALELHWVPSTAVLAGEDMSESDLELLETLGVLEPDEEIVYFYSEGLLSIKEGGNLLTDERVISYEMYEGVFWIYSANYAEISDVEVASEGNFLADAELWIYTEDDDSFLLYLSTEDGGDETFLDELHARWQRAPESSLAD